MGRNRVKPEQASKVRMRMPTLRSFGEGRTRGEVIDTRTHAIRRGSGYGTSGGWFAVTGGDWSPKSRFERRPRPRLRACPLRGRLDVKTVVGREPNGSLKKIFHSFHWLGLIQQGKRSFS